MLFLQLLLEYLQVLAQAQYLLIKANLLANVRHKLLVLNVPLLEEALVVLDF